MQVVFTINKELAASWIEGQRDYGDWYRRNPRRVEFKDERLLNRQFIAGFIGQNYYSSAGFQEGKDWAMWITCYGNVTVVKTDGTCAYAGARHAFSFQEEEILTWGLVYSAMKAPPWQVATKGEYLCEFQTGVHLLLQELDREKEGWEDNVADIEKAKELAEKATARGEGWQEAITEVFNLRTEASEGMAAEAENYRPARFSRGYDLAYEFLKSQQWDYWPYSH